MAKQKNHSHLNLSGEEMKVFGYQVVDRLVEHFLALESKPVTRIGTSSGLSSLFAERPPEDPSPPAEILTQVIDDIFGHMMHTTHPKFMAFVPSPSNFISVMADALVSGYNPFAGTWMEASGPAQVELVTINWLRQLFGLPDSAGGLFTSGGSMANLTGLAVARDTRLGEEFTAGVIYASDQTHASLARGLRVLGFSSGQYKILPADLAYRLPLAQLEQEIIADRAAGTPPILCDCQCRQHEHRGSRSFAGVSRPLPERKPLAACRRGIRRGSYPYRFRTAKCSPGWRWPIPW